MNLLPVRALSLQVALVTLLCGTAMATPISNYQTFSTALAQSNVLTNFANNSVISLTTAGQTFPITTNTLIDAGTNNVVIDGNNLTRLFYVHTNCQLTLANLILTNGLSTNGGAIYSQGVLIISNCIFSGNSATGAAGDAGSTDSTNEFAGSGGNGASVLGGAIYSTGPVSVYYSLFGTNNAVAGAGGTGGAGFTSAETTQAGNGGEGGDGGNASGGAVYTSGTNNIFFATEFYGNNCVGGVGGAGGAAGTNINSYTSKNGETGEGGGGGYAAGGGLFVAGSLSMSNCLFAFNTATAGNSPAAAAGLNGTGYSGFNGGAAYAGGLIIFNAKATGYLENSIFFENTCTGGAGANAFGTSTEAGTGGGAYGAGIYVMSTSTMIRNCTLATNTATGGLAGVDSGTNGVSGSEGAALGWDIYSYSGATTLANSILSGAADNATSVKDTGYNISSDASMSIVDSTSLKNTNPGLDSGLSIQGGAKLGPAGFDGPTMWTLALIDGSPATNAIPGVPGLTFPATDERLLPRGTPASIGAFEVDTDIITVTNAGPASITTQPTNQTATLGQSAFLSVIASPNPGDPNTLGYQWQLNGTNLAEAGNFSGVNSPILEIKNVADADLGAYQVVISPSLLDSVTNSVAAYLLVPIPTSIKSQPASRLNVPVGSIVNFAVNVGGAPPFYFQWRSNGVPLTDGNEFTGSATTNLNINPVNLDDAASYSVVVSNYFRTVTSSVARLTVVVDKTRPTVVISSPAANARTNNLVVFGTASDNAQVTNVYCWVTNIFAGVTHVFLTNAVLSTNETATKTWGVTNIFLPGTNIVAMQSVDYSSNVSPIVTRSFFYKVPSLFHLSINNENYGTVTGTAPVGGDAKPTNNAMLNVGEGYTLVATPRSTNLLSNWVSGSFVSYSSRLSFTMTTNLAIEANFVQTPFGAVEGTYNGLFYETNDSGVTVQTAGMLSGLKIGPLGTYSAQLALGGANYPITGTFNLLGQASNYVSRTASKGGPFELQMDLEWTNNQITGSVAAANGEWESPLYAEENAPSSASAESTILLEPSTNGFGATPPGDGYVLLTNHFGSLVLSGALPDGSAYSQHVPLGILGHFPVYQSLYANTGLVLGWINLTNGLPQAPNGLTWIKPSSKTDFYPEGFTNLLAVQGSLWTNSAHFSDFGTLTISNTSIDLSNFASINDDVLTGGTNSALSLKGTVNPNTGLVSITFEPGIKQATIKGYGVILENMSTLGGYFTTRTNAGLIFLEPQ